MKNASLLLEEGFLKWHNVFEDELLKYVNIWHSHELRRTCLCLSTLNKMLASSWIRVFMILCVNQPPCVKGCAEASFKPTTDSLLDPFYRQ